jgi:hypothetical protein
MGQGHLGERRGGDSWFMALFKCIFDHPSVGREGGERLLRQGDQTAAEYALTFWTIAASRLWNELVIHTLFRRALREEVKMELACRGDNLFECTHCDGHPSGYVTH